MMKTREELAGLLAWLDSTKLCEKHDFEEAWNAQVICVHCSSVKCDICQPSGCQCWNDE